MAGSTYSTNLKIELMTTGENSGTWGDITNTNLGTALEQAVVGYGNVDYVADANLTISITNSNASQPARALVLNVTSTFGSLTQTRELVVPTSQKQYIVQNNTTGGQSITVKTSAGTGITVPNGRKAHLYVNGTSVIQMFDFINILGGTIDNTTLGATTASSARVTTLNASGATTLDGTVALGNAAGDLITVPGTINSNLIFTDNTYDIGASGATRPRNLFLAGAATVGGNLSVGGTLTLTGGVNLNGNVTVGDSAADTLTINSTVTSNLIFTDNTYDIGASGATRPRNLFIAGNITAGGSQTLTGALTVDSTTDTSSATTGSIQTDGGVGIAKGLYVGGNTTLGDAAADNVTVNGTITSNLIFTDNTYDIGASGATRPRNLFLAGNATIGGAQTLTGALTVDSTTDSSSTTTGSIQTDGGVGIAKALFLGTNANVSGNANFGNGGSSTYGGYATGGRVFSLAAAGGVIPAISASTDTTASSTAFRAYTKEVANDTSYAYEIQTGNGTGVTTQKLQLTWGANGLWNSTGLAVTGTLSASGDSALKGINVTFGNAAGLSNYGIKHFYNAWNTSGYNWQVDVGYLGGTGSMCFTPSTAIGGSTFTTPVLSIATTGLAVTGTLSATGVVSGQNFSGPATGFSVGPATDSFQTGLQIFGSGGGGSAYKVVTLANNVAVATATSTGFAVNGELSATGFQFKLGTSGNSQAVILRAARPSVGSAGLQFYGGASTTVNDAAPAAYITLGSGSLGDTYEGGVGYHAYGLPTGSGFQNAHTWYRRTSVDTISQTMQITPTGVLDIATGAGAVGQIKFPSAQITSSDVNTLDDYEEGTWTPALTSTGASFTYPRGQYGTYVKIGSLVYAQFYIGADATGTTSNQCVISGLPFNAANLNALAQAGASAWVSQTTSLGFTKNNNDAIISVWQQNIGSAAIASAGQMSGGYIVGNCMYRAT